MVDKTGCEKIETLNSESGRRRLYVLSGSIAFYPGATVPAWSRHNCVELKTAHGETLPLDKNAVPPNGQHVLRVRQFKIARCDPGRNGGACKDPYTLHVSL